MANEGKLSAEPGQAPASLQNRSLPNSQQPIDATQAAAFVSSCFTLVRPISMSEAHAKEWIMMAAKELAGYPLWMVESAAASARKTCSHHGQIVPHMVKHMEGQLPWKPAAELHADRQRALGHGRVQQIEAAPEVQRLICTTARSLEAN